MARTEAGRLLTSAYRRQQLQIRAVTLADLLRIWRGFDIENIDESWPPVHAGLTVLVTARHRTSAAVAANYFRAFRVAEQIPGSSPARLAPALDREVVSATLNLLGPIGAKKNIAAGTPDPAGRTLARVSGSVGRQVLNGGRQTLTASVQADPAAKGYRRDTDGDPCDYCARKAGEITATEFEAHDNCGCTQEPVY